MSEDDGGIQYWQQLGQQEELSMNEYINVRIMGNANGYPGFIDIPGDSIPLTWEETNDIFSQLKIAIENFSNGKPAPVSPMGGKA